jgi:hypothetical protein
VSVRITDQGKGLRSAARTCNRGNTKKAGFSSVFVILIKFEICTGVRHQGLDAATGDPLLSSRLPWRAPDQTQNGRAGIDQSMLVRPLVIRRAAVGREQLLAIFDERRVIDPKSFR